MDLRLAMTTRYATSLFLLYELRLIKKDLKSIDIPGVACYKTVLGSNGGS